MTTGVPSWPPRGRPRGLIRVGRGFYTPEKVKEILEAKVHTSEGTTALPNGLVLVKIDYK